MSRLSTLRRRWQKRESKKILRRERHLLRYYNYSSVFINLSYYIMNFNMKIHFKMEKSLGKCSSIFICSCTSIIQMYRLHWTKLPFCWIYPLLKGLGMTRWSGLLNVMKWLDSPTLRDLYYTKIEYEQRGTSPSSFLIFKGGKENYLKRIFCKLSHIPHMIKIFGCHFCFWIQRGIKILEIILKFGLIEYVIIFLWLERKLF